MLISNTLISWLDNCCQWYVI